MKNSRKMIDALVNAVFLFLGLLAAAKLEADSNLYYAFVAGVVGKAAAFTWGNAKEHQAKGGNDAEPK